MAQDIIASVAWTCGDEPPECGSPGGWHMANYWIDDTADTGYTLDNYADGDHDEVEESDLPTPEEVVQSWRDYEAWVAENGLDPLGNFMVPRSVTTQTRTYTVTLGESILGPIILRVRRNHRDAMADLATVAPLREYLLAKRGGTGRWFVNDPDEDGKPIRLAAIATFHGKPIRNYRLTVTFPIEVERPDAERRRRAALVRIAKGGVR